MERALSAAGKLFLSGEYAVLWGGTARIACVGPRTFAHVKRRDDREVRILLTEGAVHAMTTPLGANWSGEVPPEFSFVARTIDLALRAHGKEALGFDLALSPSPVGEGGRKLGMGSSARAVVLTAEACRFILEDRYDALKLSLAAHALAQGGKGSGGDVAASFAGGIVRYRRFDLARIAASAESGPFLASLIQSPPVDVWKLPPRPLQLS
ncbi:MAG: mevalonate kinase, partial [Myxococcaceae bacterium]